MGNKRKEAIASAPNTNGNIVQSVVNSKTSSSETQKRQREKDRLEREGIVLWKKPVQTVEYFLKECLELGTHYGRK